MGGVCSGPGPCDVTPLGEGKNWVTKVGGLPLYIRAIAHALRRSGHSQSEAIQLAVGTVQRWARGGGNVTAATRGRAAAALAEWERKRAEAHLSGSDAVDIIDLAYQWKHGWIPLTPASLAIKLHKAHGGASGLKSNDVRKALGTHKDFREGVEAGRAEVRNTGHGLDDVYNGADLRNKARIHEGLSEDALKRGDLSGATRHAGQAAGLRHEAMLSQRRSHAQATPKSPKSFSDQYVKTGKPTKADVDHLVDNYRTMHGKPPSEQMMRRLNGKAGMMNFSRVDLTFDPSEARTPTGTWTTGSGSSAPSSPAQVKAQASAVGVDPAVLQAVAKNLGLSTAQLSGMVQQANAAKAAKKSSGGSGGGSGGGGASTVAAAQTKRVAALKAAKAAFTAAEKKQAAQDLATTKLQLASTLATNAKPTTASTTKAKAINALPDAQRALLNGSVPPAGFRWGNNGSLVTQAGASLSGGNRMSVDLASVRIDLASQSQLLPDMDSVRKAAGKLSKLPPPLRKAMAARLQARAKQLGATLNLSGSTGRIVDLAVDQAQRDAAKSAGLTFPGTDSFPLAGPDGKFDAGLAKKAVGMVQLSNAASAPAIRKWLMTKLKANGAAGIIPTNWQADGTVKSA